MYGIPITVLIHKKHFMPHLNFEFKAKVENTEELEQKLIEAFNPSYLGEDDQTDTYFNIATGRLKLREGNIENSLIYYERSNSAESKSSNVILYEHKPDKNLKEILTKVHGVKVIVDKKRKIYFVENVKIHFDKLVALGSFIEVEAIDKDDTIGIERLKEQCLQFATFFNIKPQQFVAHSYSDL